MRFIRTRPRKEETICKCPNRFVEVVWVKEEIMRLEKGLWVDRRRAEKLRLTGDELSLYDALEPNDSAIKVLGDDMLRTIARELTETVRSTISTDWAVRESIPAKLRVGVRSRLRVLVKRVLRKHGYPLDKQEKSTQAVLEQGEIISVFSNSTGTPV